MAISNHLKTSLENIYEKYVVAKEYIPDALQSASRALRNKALFFLAYQDGGELAKLQVQEALNMTDQLSAFSPLIKHNPTSESINFFYKARNSFKYSEKTKKARVFDFDDTLVKSNSKVYVVNKGKKKTLTPGQFAIYKKKSGDEFDFSDYPTRVGTTYSIEDEWDDTIFTASASYNISNDNNIYVNYSEGFRSGGFSIRSAGDPSEAPYEPEYADQIEIGSKNEFFDRFRSRIMFPIWNASGKIVGFGGRVFASDDPAKYMNSPVALNPFLI